MAAGFGATGSNAGFVGESEATGPGVGTGACEYTTIGAESDNGVSEVTFSGWLVTADCVTV